MKKINNYAYNYLINYIGGILSKEYNNNMRVFVTGKSPRVYKDTDTYIDVLQDQTLETQFQYVNNPSR